jgi:hypothetical protein
LWEASGATLDIAEQVMTNRPHDIVKSRYIPRGKLSATSGRLQIRVAIR